MSSFASSQRHLDATAGREVVYCHACQHEWYRDDQEGIVCPSCHGEATEIVSPPLEACISVATNTLC